MTSIHLQNFPDVSTLPDNPALVSQMDRVRDACNAGLSVRNAENIRVRQPLSRLTLVTEGASALAAFADIIKEEINVKEVVLEEDISTFADFRLKINFPVLGKRLPEKMKQIIPASKKGEWERLPDGRIRICGEVLEQEECEFQLEPKEKKGAQALSTNDALVVLDLTLTESLKQEGIARDVVRFIQQSRKEADLAITDRIALFVAGGEEVNAAVQAFSAYIAQQTLSASLTVAAPEDCPHCFSQKLEGQEVTVGFRVV